MAVPPAPAQARPTSRKGHWEMLSITCPHPVLQTEQSQRRQHRQDPSPGRGCSTHTHTDRGSHTCTCLQMQACTKKSIPLLVHRLNPPPGCPLGPPPSLWTPKGPKPLLLEFQIFLSNPLASWHGQILVLRVQGRHVQPREAAAGGRDAAGPGPAQPSPLQPEAHP